PGLPAVARRSEELVGRVEDLQLPGAWAADHPLERHPFAELETGDPVVAEPDTADLARAVGDRDLEAHGVGPRDQLDALHDARNPSAPARRAGRDGLAAGHLAGQGGRPDRRAAPGRGTRPVRA